MPTPVDQRLASQGHQQQVVRLGRSERAAQRVGRPYSTLAADLAAIAAEGLPAADLAGRVDRALTRAAEQARGDLEASLVDQVRWSRTEAVDALLGTVPLRWFRVAVPALAALSVGEAENPFPLDTEYEYEPVLSISPEEAKAKLRELLFPPLDSKRVEEYLAGGHGGVAWDERLAHWDRLARDQIRGQIVQGISAGEGYAEIRKRLQPITDGVAYKAQRIARTESRRVAERAQTAAYEALGDMLEGMQVIATLDQWTRPEHAARNGKIYYRQKGGGYVAKDGQVLPELPDAPNCRCFATPVLKPPAEFASDPAFRADLRNAGGDAIPDPSAYTQWFDRADDQRRKLAVGAKRYRVAAARLRRTQRPEWSDFIDEDGRLLSPEKLLAETATERAARKRRVAAMLAKRELLYKEAVAQGFVNPAQNRH